MKVLITGAAGYVGSCYFNHLHHSPQTRFTALDKFAKKSQSLIHCSYSPYITIADREFSELDLASLKNYDILIHLASVVGAKACETNPEEATRTNLELTKAIIERKGKDQRFIFTNTNCGYSAEGICDERTPLTPNSHYGKTKVAAEKIWLEGGGISLRFASLFGPSPKMRNDLLLNFLVREALFKGKIELFEGGFKRNFLSVFDACEAINHIIGAGEEGEAYNVGIEDENYTKLEVCKLIQRHLPNITITEKEAFEKDPDERNYTVTNKKIMKTGYRTVFSIDDGIEMLIKYHDYIGNTDSLRG